MMKNTFLFFILIFSFSCSMEQKRKAINEVYIPSGAEQYFLPNLPSWANVSTAADCRRMQTIRFFDFDKLNKSYNLSYEQLLQFQLMFNYELLAQLKSLPPTVELRPRDEEVLFFNVMEKIKGGSTIFLSPEFRDINLIWVDDAINDKINIGRVKKLLKTEMMDQGFPIFVSTCLTWIEMEKFLGDLGLQEGSKFISAEFFSPFTNDFILGIRTGIDLDKLFKENQRLNFYSNRDVIPSEIRGHLRLKKY